MLRRLEFFKARTEIFPSMSCFRLTILLGLGIIEVIQKCLEITSSVELKEISSNQKKKASKEIALESVTNED